MNAIKQILVTIALLVVSGTFAALIIYTVFNSYSDGMGGYELNTNSDSISVSQDATWKTIILVSCCLVLFLYQCFTAFRNNIVNILVIISGLLLLFWAGINYATYPPLSALGYTDSPADNADSGRINFAYKVVKNQTITRYMAVIFMLITAYITGNKKGRKHN